MKIFNQRIEIILLKVYKRNSPLSFKYIHFNFNIDCFYFWTQDKRLMLFTYISSFTIHHCTLSQIMSSCKNDAHNLEQNKYLPTVPHFCAQLSSTEFSGPLYIRRMELRSVLILKHLETKKATITERTKWCTTKKPPEDPWWKAAGPLELLFATEREKNSKYLSLGDKTWIPSSRVWATDATEVGKSLKTQKSEDKKDSKRTF